MISYFKDSNFLKFFRFWVSIVLFVCFLMVSYIRLNPYVDQIIYHNALDELPLSNGDILNSDQKKNIDKKWTTERGLRSVKINVNTDLPKDATEKVLYKDVEFVSTSARAFQQNEIEILKIIIDEMPQTLYDYRPWAVISIDFKTSSITRTNPEGVAFASGPYIYVSDVTFSKQSNYDTGTMRGLSRILYHEFTHVAQFFTTNRVTVENSSNYLEESEMIKNWVQTQGWTKDGDSWRLDDSEATTKYGSTDPVEDMADSMGALLVGDEYSVSKFRIDWLVEWLKVSKETILLGTIPLSPTLSQRKVEASDNAILKKYEDKSALTQDIMNFQSTETISKKSLASFYNNEFKKRGWTGSLNNNGVGEFHYKERYKLNIEMDENPLRVATMVMTVH